MATVDIIHGDCTQVLAEYTGKADLVLTSPPYGTMREYEGNLDAFQFEPVAWTCYDLLKPNGVLVWVVDDQSVDRSLTLEPMHQAMYFKDELGLLVVDIMIYQKSWPRKAGRKYLRSWEYMLVLAKGPDYTFNPIVDRPNAWAGWQRWGKKTLRDADGSLNEVDEREKYTVPAFGIRNNVWSYVVGAGHTTEREWASETLHPAQFPLKLALDHVQSWTNEGDMVIDPMAGGGTTLKAAHLLGRNAVGAEVVQEYAELIERRLTQRSLI